MIQLRMPQTIHQGMRSDLGRSHPFAFERVGYLFIKTVGDKVLVATGYESVPDKFYIRDLEIGARIDHRGIALAMKRADNNNEGILLAHIHPGSGFPRFSKVDQTDHPNFLRSFRNANPKMPHGFLLMSKDKLMARVWIPGSESSTDIFRYTVVGQPLTFHWPEVNRI